MKLEVVITLGLVLLAGYTLYAVTIGGHLYVG